jgi:hypothetical protein
MLAALQLASIFVTERALGPQGKNNQEGSNDSPLD